LASKVKEQKTSRARAKRRHKLQKMGASMLLFFALEVAACWMPISASSAAFLTPRATVRNGSKTRAKSRQAMIADTYLSTLSHTPISVSEPVVDNVAKREALVPEQQENPAHVNSCPSSRSISGVPYSLVQSGLDLLYPPTELDKRNALSRSDGYWPYIKDGEDPPEELTYGEFEFDFFASLLDRAHELYVGDPRNTAQSDWSGKSFVDIGSGAGRLVFGAAALHPWGLSRGIELLDGINQAALDHLKALGGGSKPFLPTEDDHQLSLSPVQFTCGSFEDPSISFAGADLLFFFSTCIPMNVLNSFAKSVGRQCRPGTLVITTDYMLPLQGNIPSVCGNDAGTSLGDYTLSLVEQVDGTCWLTGGTSTAFIHKVEKSLWTDDNGPG
jgi:SAM-dependent methyltransferase